MPVPVAPGAPEPRRGWRRPRHGIGSPGGAPSRVASGGAPLLPVEHHTDDTMLERVQRALGPGLRVERELGRGAMGVVFLGRDVALERPVAIKVLPLDQASTTAEERFRREARLLARLRHPNIVQIHQAGEADGFRWFVMDYIEGETLAARLARGPLRADVAVHIAAALLDALAAAHRAGVVHRDVKPANVFLTEGEALLGDFGVASGATSEDTLTSAGGLVGTPDYMAPEQAAGEPATPASDLYAVAEILYESLTGQRWLRACPPEEADWEGVPRGLVAPLRRALAPRPEARWPDAGRFRDALRQRPRVRALVLSLGAALTAGALGAVWLLPFDCGLPGPLRPDGFLQRLAVCRAEAQYEAARWNQARDAFTALLGRDSTCALCRFRLVDIDRWLGHRRDDEAFQWLARHRARFPADWRALLEAELAPPAERLAALEQATVAWQDSHLAWYLLGEERFHRGALAGRSRRDARLAFERALALRPRFVAPLFDLALLYVALGDSANAAATLAELQELGALDGVADLERATGGVAFGFRFGVDPMPLVRSALADSLSPLAAGPRILLAFGLPEGAIALGRFFEDSGGRALHRSGLLSQVFGHAARGELEAMRAAGRRLRRAYPDPVLRLVELEIEGALHLFDPGAGRADAVLAELELLTHQSQPPVTRHRAALLRTLHSVPGAGLPPDAPPAMHALAAAWRQAEGGNRAGALLTTEPLSGVDAPDEGRVGPFFRSLVRLARGAWAAADGHADGARLAWRWHEHFDMHGFPIGDPTTSDADWTLGTLARWLIVRSADQAEGDAEVCHALAEVARMWSTGDAPFRSRADSARTRRSALACADSP